MKSRQDIFIGFFFFLLIINSKIVTIYPFKKINETFRSVLLGISIFTLLQALKKSFIITKYF